MVRSVFLKCQPDNDRVRDSELGLREDSGFVSVISGGTEGHPLAVLVSVVPSEQRALQAADVEEALWVLLVELRDACEGLERSSEHLLSPVTLCQVLGSSHFGVFIPINPQSSSVNTYHPSLQAQANCSQ